MDHTPRPWDAVTLIHVWGEDGTKRTYGPFWGWIPHRSDPLIAERRFELETVMQNEIPDDVLPTNGTITLNIAKVTEYQNWLEAERRRLAPTARRRPRRQVMRAIPKVLGYGLYAIFTLWCLAWAISMWMLAIIPAGIWLTVTIAIAANRSHRLPLLRTGRQDGGPGSRTGENPTHGR